MTSYISFCEDVCADKDLPHIQQQQQWFIPSLMKLRQAKEEAYRCGDLDLYKQARNKLTQEI